MNKMFQLSIYDEIAIISAKDFREGYFIMVKGNARSRLISWARSKPIDHKNLMESLKHFMKLTYLHQSNLQDMAY